MKDNAYDAIQASVGYPIYLAVQETVGFDFDRAARRTLNLIKLATRTNISDHIYFTIQDA